MFMSTRGGILNTQFQHFTSKPLFSCNPDMGHQKVSLLHNISILYNNNIVKYIFFFTSINYSLDYANLSLYGALILRIKHSLEEWQAGDTFNFQLILLTISKCFHSNPLDITAYSV